MAPRNQPYYRMRPLLNGRMEVWWSNGATHAHFFSESKRATEIVQSFRDLHGGGPSQPAMIEPRFGKVEAAAPHPGQTAMDIEEAIDE